jgi:hypothetical protein
MVDFGRQMDAAASIGRCFGILGQDFLEAIRCQEREIRIRRDKTGDVVGRPSWRSLFLGDPGAEFLCGKLRIGTKKRGAKRQKGRWHSGGGNKSFTGGTNGRKNECLRDRV